MTKCPRCNNQVDDRLIALSRRDNKTMICEACGGIEAMNDSEPYRMIGSNRILDEMIFQKKLGLDVKEWIDWKKDLKQ